MARQAQSDDIQAMLALFRANYGDVDVAQASYFRWQYEDNPAGPAHIWLAEDQSTGVLAGQYVVVPTRLCLDGVERLGCLSLNTLTDERYRGRGIFTGLARRLFSTLSEHGVALTYGFPNPSSYPGFVGKLGFRDIGQVPLLVKPLRLRGLARRRFGPFAGPPIGLVADALRAVLVRRIRASGGLDVRVQTVHTLPPEFDAFWARQRARHRLVVVRDARYLEWRYLRCPTRTYTLLVAEAGGEIKGYLVGRVAELAGVLAGWVVDLFVEDSDPGRAASLRLLAAWEERCADEGAEVLAGLMLSHAPEAGAMRAAGYWRVPRRLLPQPIPVIVLEHDRSLPPLGLRDWFLTFGDYDIV